MLISPDDSKFIEVIAEKVADKLRATFQRPEQTATQEKIYLTRKRTAEKLGISSPTVDQFVHDGILEKLGSGKRTRFRLEDVENLFENLDKFYKRQRKNTHQV